MLTTLVTLAALSLSWQTATAPARNCSSVKGKFVGRLVKAAPCPPGGLCIDGNLSGGLKGKYAFHVTKQPVPAGEPAPQTINFFVGASTVTLKNGATLTGIDTGTIDMPPGLGGFASLITWTSGATGQIRLRGVMNPAAETTSGEYEGTVCR